MVRRDDRGHDVAAEGWTGLEQVPGFCIDVEHGAVRGQAGVEFRGDFGDERTADSGGSSEDDLGLMERCERGDYGAVGIVVEIAERRGVRHVYNIGAVGYK